MSEIKVEYLFPSQVVIGKLENFNDIKFNLIEWIYNYKENNQTYARISNVNSWQSLSKTVFLDEGFKKFQEPILNLITKLVSEYKIYKEVSLVQMWININGPHSYNVSHRHPGCDLSGCLWIKCPPESGRFVFDNMDTGYRDYGLYGSMNQNHLIENKMCLEYVPEYEDGNMIIFPASLTHRVELNEIDEDRISMGFNLKIINSVSY
jgi:uncharacterized protein (TIGR02466 family)